MIHESTVTATLPLSDELALRGLLVTTQPSTALNELVRLTNKSLLADMVKQHSSGEGINIEEYSALVRSMSDDDVSVYGHNTAIDQLTETLIPAVSRHVSFARNVVIPAVRELRESVNEQLRHLTPPKPEDAFTVMELGVPDFAFSALLRSDIKRYDGKNPLLPKAPMNHAEKEESSLLELLSTGDGSFDTEVLSWLGKLKAHYELKGIDLLKTVWLNHFCIKLRPITTISTSDILKMNVLEKTNYALLIFLLARKLTLQVDESNQSSQSLSEYKDHAVWWRDFAGTVLNDGLQRLKSMEAMGWMVIENNKLKKHVVVFDKLYHQWLETSGSVEILLGSLLSSVSASSVKELDQYRDKFQNEWKAHKLFFDATQTNQATDKLKDVLVYCFNESFKRVGQEEQAYHERVSQAKQLVQQYLHEELASITIADAADPSLLIERVVTKARFYYTDSSIILETMRQHSDLQPREAALLATIKYIVSYLVDQMRVTDKL